MKVFISRTLDEQGDFYRILTHHGHQVRGESLVRFFPVPVGDFPRADWVFFTGQTAARFFFRQFSPKKVEDIHLAAMGRATAEVVSHLCRPPDFTGNGDPIATANAFLQLAQGQQVLFPQANNSRQSIQTLLNEHITAFDLVVYDNQPRTDFDLPFFDVLVFTSPLNARAYFSKKSLQGRQKVIAIGNTTAKTLLELGIGQVTVAEVASEESLASSVLKG